MSVHVFAFLKRRPDITREQFQDYWGNKHAHTLTSLKAVRENLVKYSQFHTLGPASEVLSAAGVSVAPYDGVAEFWVEKLEDAFALFKDEEYQNVAHPDEDNFVDRSAVQLMVGVDQVKWEKEKA